METAIDENAYTHEDKGIAMAGACTTAEMREQRAKEALSCLRLAGHNPKSGLLVDIGCGPGYLTRYFSKVGIKAIGVDVSRRSVRAAKKRIAPRGSFILASGLELPFRKQCFSTVILNDVLEHVSYDLANSMLNEIKRVLRVDGELYISVANRYQIREPHTLIPFLTWLPRSCWDAVCRLIKKRRYQSYYPYTIGKLRRLCLEVGLGCINYTWFYAWNRISGTRNIGDPTVRKLVKMTRKFKLCKPA